MKTDLYTKAVLTIIAIALVSLVLQNMNIITPAQASQSVPPKVVPSVAPPMDVNIVSVNGNRIQSDYSGNLNVNVVNTVEMKNPSGGLDVKVVNTPKVEMSSPYGGIEVKVSNYRDFQK